VLCETDDYCYNIVSDPVHIHDLQATDSQPPGRGSKTPHVQIPGPALPPDDVSGEVVKKLLA